MKFLDEYRVLEYIISLSSSTRNDEQEASGIWPTYCDLFSVLGLKLLLNIRQLFLANHFFISGVTLPLLLLAKDDNLKSIWLSPYSDFHFDNHKEKRLRIGLSYLHEHKFQVQFRKLLKPICSCDLDIESSSHFLLPCALFNDERYSLFSTLNFTDCSILELASSSFPQTLVQIIW